MHNQIFFFNVTGSLFSTYFPRATFLSLYPLVLSQSPLTSLNGKQEESLTQQKEKVNENTVHR